MKNLIKLLLTLIFIPVSILCLFSITAKFQLLNSNFWKNDFKNNNVYVKLSEVIKTAAENQTEKGGGKKGDFQSLTDIITPNLVEDFVSRNIDNFIGFANGKSKELLVYIPITKIPKEFSPKSVGLNSEEIPLTALLSKFNITVGQDLPISQIAYFGMAATYALAGLLSVLLICIFLLFLLTENGKRFVFPGLALFLSGVIILVVSIFGYAIKTSMLTDWAKGTEPSQIILSTFAPYVLQEVLRTWAIVGFIMVILGIVLFFIKKQNGSRQI